MMVEPTLVLLVADATDSLQAAGRLRSDYLVSVLLTLIAPVGFQMLSVPWWAGHLDRVHITRFRVRQSWFWVGSQGLTWIGAIVVARDHPAVGLAIIAAGRIVLGVARGGGMLAWQLGHNDFASREMVAVYMGVHQTLTGIRGLFAPFLGMALFTGWPAVTIPGAGLTLPGFEGGLGAGVFFICLLLSTTAGFGFLGLHRFIVRTGAITSDEAPNHGR
jgi:hypothetical protein